MSYEWSIDGVRAIDRDEIPTPQIGAELDYSFIFERRPNARDAEQRHADVLDRLHYATDEHLDIHPVLEGAPMYTDQSPEGYDPLVEIDATGSGPPRVPRVWGLIVGGDDAADPSGAVLAVDLDVLALAPLAEYNDRATVKDEFEATGPA
jgi:hypothetical protein